MSVVITGSAAICGLGGDAEAIWSAIRAGRSAVAPLGNAPSRRAAAIVDYDARQLVDDRKTLKFIRRSHVFGLNAGRRAIEQAGFLAQRSALPTEAAAAFNDRSGIYVGASGAEYQDQYDYLPLLARSDGELSRFGAELTQTVHPMWLLQTLPNNVLCHLGIQSGFSGPHACIVNHSTSGVLAVAEAAAALREGAIDRAVAVAHQAPIEPQTLAGYAALGLLADDDVRPFDRSRDGCVLGEGAAALALETGAGAAARGQAILGEILGAGAVSEGGALFDVRDDGDGLARAIELALNDAGCTARDVGMIVTHGNGTRASDASEAAAIAQVFGDTAPPATSFKWATGHLLAAAGVLDSVLALAALRTGEAPGIATLRERDPACAAVPVARHAQPPRSDIALVLSRGFAGTNAALLVRGSRSDRSPM